MQQHLQYSLHGEYETIKVSTATPSIGKWQDYGRIGVILVAFGAIMPKFVDFGAMVGAITAKIVVFGAMTGAIIPKFVIFGAIAGAIFGVSCNE